jgi:protein kinase C substrate 80K-H
MSKSTRLEIAQSLGLDQLNFEQLSLIIVDLSTQLYQKDDVLKAIRVQLDASHLGASPIEKEEEAFKIRDAERQKETERIEKLMEEKRKAKEAAEAAAKTQAEAEGVTYTPPPTVETTDEIELKVPEVETRPVILLFDKVSASQTHRREEAEQARTALREAENLQKEQEKQVSSLQEALSKSYGNENVLYSLRDRCVESRSGQYVYSMCYYGHAKQDSISLGMMEPPVFPEGDEDKITLKFTKGTKCWNGPERSLSVTFQCGAQEELYQIEEPETCVYKALLKTPLGCSKKILSAMTSEVEVSATL